MLALRGRPARLCACVPRVAEQPSSVAAFSTSAAQSISASHAARTKFKKMRFAKTMTPERRDAARRAQAFKAGLGGEIAAEIAAAEAAVPAPATTSVSFGPSVADFEQFIPLNEPIVTKPTYPRIHAKLVDALDNAFVRTQLIDIAAKLKNPISIGRSDRKADVIQKLLDRYKWIAPVSPETFEPHTKDIFLTRAEVFLLHGDRAAMDWLGGFPRLRMSVQTMEQPGMYAFNVTAPPAVIDEVERFFHYRRKLYARLEWTASEMLDFVPPSSTLWAISGATGVCVEQTPKGNFVATAPSMTDAQRARGMALAVAAQAMAPHPPLAALLAPALPSGADTYYALTPHHPAMSSPLPWDTAAIAGGRPLFRLTTARANEGPSDRELRQRTAHLGTSSVVSLDTDTVTAESSLSSLVDGALASLRGVSGAVPSVVVRFGHLLSPSDGTSMLTPPIKGAWPLDAQGPWADMPPPLFCPAIPPVLIRDVIPAGNIRTRTVTYRRAGANDRLVVSYSFEPEVREAATPEAPGPAWFQKLDDMLPSMMAHGEAEDDFKIDSIHALLGDDKAASAGGGNSMLLNFSVAAEKPTDVLLPERPIDARVLARTSRALPQTEVPPELGVFFAHVHANPGARDVPLSDLATLRRGTGPEAPPAPEASEETWGDEHDFEVHPARAAEAEVDELTAAPRPMPPVAAAETGVLAPPLSVLYAGETFYLERDEVRDVAEVVRRGVRVRSVAAVDLRGPGGVVRYAEIEAGRTEGAEAFPGLYAEMAAVSCALVPGAKQERLGW